VGVEKDLGKALEYIRQVARSNREADVRDQIFDLLLEIDDPDLYQEMVDSVYRLAMNKSPNPQARYGLA
jgi:hypothetical protein